ncbi:hypothetical protein GCM10023264_18270 [Sphingomonas daechungensis]|uniref:Uncharacterized protein n=1 Tax=Sphingomonas daechungensis TaxID=1176646 RepID=A0ABX6T2B4_9SPHN|nr:hypothetical protein [Sphingomonas daechungensis]QNP44002.1 hypothetical protein H9L15_05250 [Sphingomonas daechungensis]
MLSGLSAGLKVVLGVQFVLALLFLALGWSHTSSMTFGRTPSFADMVALAAPLALVVAGSIASAGASRRGQRGLAQVFALIPIPLAILLATLAGLV